jgi:hypothetical protein
MSTIHAITQAALSARQLNSLRSLQEKVELRPSTFTRVSPAQFNAMQAAYSAVKASGVEIPALAQQQAKELGLV